MRCIHDNRTIVWIAARACLERWLVIYGCPESGPSLLPVGNRLYIAWFTVGADSRPRVLASWSDDRGRSFAAPVEVSTGALDANHPMLFAGKPGGVWATFLYLARRIRLARGAVAVFLVVGNAFVAAAQSNYYGQFVAVIVASAVAGAVANSFRLDPADQLPYRWRVAAFSLPTTYWAVHLGVLALTMGCIWQSPDVVFGSILFGGLIGLFLNALTGPFRQQ